MGIINVRSKWGLLHEEESVPAFEVNWLETETMELERTLGPQTMQINNLKEAAKSAREKNLTWQKPLQEVDVFA